MHVVGRWTSFAEVAGVGRGGLTRTCTTKHALEDCQTLIVGDDLFQTDGGNVQLRARC